MITMWLHNQALVLWSLSVFPCDPSLAALPGEALSEEWHKWKRIQACGAIIQHIKFSWLFNLEIISWWKSREQKKNSSQVQKKNTKIITVKVWRESCLVEHLAFIGQVDAARATMWSQGQRNPGVGLTEQSLNSHVTLLWRGWVVCWVMDPMCRAGTFVWEKLIHPVKYPQQILLRVCALGHYSEVWTVCNRDFTPVWVNCEMMMCRETCSERIQEWNCQKIRSSCYCFWAELSREGSCLTAKSMVGNRARHGWN